MSEDVKQENNNGSKSLLSQIKAEAQKAKRDAAKAQLKTLYSELNKATEVRDGILEKIVELVSSVGDSEAEVKLLLAE